MIQSQVESYDYSNVCFLQSLLWMWHPDWVKPCQHVCRVPSLPSWHHRRHPQVWYPVFLQVLWKVRKETKFKKSTTYPGYKMHTYSNEIIIFCEFVINWNTRQGAYLREFCASLIPRESQISWTNLIINFTSSLQHYVLSSVKSQF